MSPLSQVQEHEFRQVIFDLLRVFTFMFTIYYSEAPRAYLAVYAPFGRLDCHAMYWCPIHY